MAAPYIVYQALGDPTRLEIVQRLGTHGPMPTLELVKGLGMTRQAATKHLTVLENAGLIASAQQGRTVVRTLNTRSLNEASDWLWIRAQNWEQKLQALKRLVEKEA